MKTTAKQLTNYGNIGLVQLRTEPETTFPFKCGSEAIKPGGLIITESATEGVVGKLIARNNTGYYLLLTDADVLTGAKQNRILNKSILLKPESETIIEVSCIERLRWHYSGKNFSSPGTVADSSLRRDKAASISCRKIIPGEPQPDTQRIVWSHIKSRITDAAFEDITESYEALISFQLEEARFKQPVTVAENGCNGLAVIADKKVVCVDMFGTEEVYREYFPKLRDSAFRLAKTGKDIIEIDAPEAYYKVLDTLDNCILIDPQVDYLYKGAGKLEIKDSEEMTGFRLSADGHLIHEVMFTK